MKAFCLFEQSGTFKNAFRKYGVEAEEVDGYTETRVQYLATKRTERTVYLAE